MDTWEPLPGTELKEAWKLVDAPKNDKFQYTHFVHKINSFDTALKKLLASDSRLRPDRYALEQSDLSKAGFEKSRVILVGFSSREIMIEFKQSTRLRPLIRVGFFRTQGYQDLKLRMHPPPLATPQTQDDLALP
ncbi:hypothetical protein GOBAR_DD03751 [Gossypium barbadense]|nr:hypothetical protein GOBAR_DD03751 [Gossypium barbadense]